MGKRFDLASTLLEEITTDVINPDGFIRRTVLQDAGPNAQPACSTNWERPAPPLQKVWTARRAISQRNWAGPRPHSPTNMEENTQSISTRFEGHASSIINYLTQSAGDFETRASEASRRLEDTGSKFSTHVDQAYTMMTDALKETAGELDQRIDTVSTSLVGRLDATSGKISERLESASEKVDRAVSNFNERIDRLMDSRDTQMATLLTKLGKKSEEGRRHHASLYGARRTITVRCQQSHG